MLTKITSTTLGLIMRLAFMWCWMMLDSDKDDRYNSWTPLAALGYLSSSLEGKYIGARSMGWLCRFFLFIQRLSFACCKFVFLILRLWALPVLLHFLFVFFSCCILNSESNRLFVTSFFCRTWRWISTSADALTVICDCDRISIKVFQQYKVYDEVALYS